MAAREGNPEAVEKVAFAYYRGDGVDPDFGEALFWFMKGAEEGHALSAYNVGVMNENGEGVPKNKKKALEWYRKADTQGYDKAISAVERLEGQLAKAAQLKADAFVDALKNDVPGAVRKFKQLAEFGDDVGIYTMGTFYENGYGVTKNLEEAKRYYESAAQYGNQDAIDALEKLGSE